VIAGYGLILASSVGERDGMALELTKVDGERVAEVFQDSVDGARTFTVFGEQQVPKLSTVLRAAAQVAGHDGELISANDDWLTAQNVNFWAGPHSLPLWLLRSDAGFARRGRSRYLAAGGTERSLTQTLEDVLADERTRGLDRERRSGLTREEEHLLLDELADR